MGKLSGAYELQAFRILQFTFALSSILAGVDKFLHFFTDWTIYLSPSTLQFLAGNEKHFLMAVGAMEILVGIGVLFKPKLFSYVMALWLFCIVINMLFLQTYYDVALRDFSLAMAALALGRLSRKYA